VKTSCRIAARRFESVHEPVRRGDVTDSVEETPAMPDPRSPQGKRKARGKPSHASSPVKWKPKTRWRDKLTREQAPKIVDIPPRMQRQWGRGTMAIARPLDVDALMRKVRKGKVATVKQIMTKLAEIYGSDTMCPMTTGIFIRIVAEAAEEDRAAGKTRITPYWRTLKGDGKLNEKYPGGVEAQAARLVAEGHQLLPGRGKQPPAVKEYEKKLMRW